MSGFSSGCIISSSGADFRDQDDQGTRISDPPEYIRYSEDYVFLSLNKNLLEVFAQKLKFWWSDARIGGWIGEIGRVRGL